MPTYIYAITASDHPLRLEGLDGVGDPAGTIRTVRTDAVSAVVSEAPAELRAKRRDLVAHQAVLDRLLADGAVLPMRFGLVGPDDQEVRAALERHQDTYTQRLKDLDGCVEYNLKVTRNEDDAVREVLAESAEAQRLNEATRTDPAAYEEKVALGELIAREIEQRAERTREEIVALLSPHAEVHVFGTVSQEPILNVSFLVRRENADRFTESVQEEARRRGDAFVLDVHGPLPPYSFV